MIFVLNKDKKPLSPCHESVARKLLKDGKAVIHKKYPFTIRLKELKTTENDSNFGSSLFRVGNLHLAPKCLFNFFNFSQVIFD